MTRVPLNPLLVARHKNRTPSKKLTGDVHGCSSTSDIVTLMPKEFVLCLRCGHMSEETKSADKVLPPYTWGDLWLQACPSNS